MSRNAGSDTMAAYFFIAPAIVGFTVFVVYPLIRSCYLALTKYNGLSDPVFVALGNFRRLFTVDPAFWPSRHLHPVVQVGDLTTAYYQPILQGKKPISDLQTYVGKINDLIKQGG